MSEITPFTPQEVYALERGPTYGAPELTETEKRWLATVRDRERRGRGNAVSESYQEQLSRVEMMAAGTDDTWDLSDNDCLALQAILKCLSECDELQRRAHNAERELASTADLLNSWARESGVTEVNRPMDIRVVIDGLWSRQSCKIDELQRQLSEARNLLTKYMSAWQLYSIHGGTGPTYTKEQGQKGEE
jgi:hypothetical protein